jgi:hypothetical protein
MTALRLSGKNLGDLAAPGHCPRCFWLKNRLALPYQFFPGIFSSIDAYSKRVTDRTFERLGKLPAWLKSLDDLGVPVHPPGHAAFQTTDPGTGILLTGDVDAMFRDGQGRTFIADYKTARYTQGQDALLPVYEVQLNAYAFIAERTGWGPVKGLALIYYEPATELEGEGVLRHVAQDGFTLEFRPSLHPVALDLERLPPLLARAREILARAEPPEGRAGCKDCAKVSALVEAVNPFREGGS